MTTTSEATRLIFTSIEEPIKAYAPWPCGDSSLEVIDIGVCVARLPHGDPRMNLEDGWVSFMQEAWRCLAPGGLLTVVAPKASHSLAVAHPENVRFFNEASFRYFGRDQDDTDGRFVKGGKDYETRFEILKCADQGSTIACMMEKPE